MYGARVVDGTIMRISLKAKLIVSFLAVIVIGGLVTTLVGTRLIGTGIIRQAQDKVRNDLNAAREIYRQESEKLKDTVRFTALRRFFIGEALLNNDITALTKELERIRKAESLDILTLTDDVGRVVVRFRNPSISGDSQADDVLVSRVLAGREAVAATVIVPEEELRKEGPDLAEQARIEYIPTPKAKPTLETKQTSAMCIKAAAPILGDNGQLLGVLYGGNLLNRNYEIVDKVKETVYQAVKYEGKDIGTATIFQGDLRISTNVLRADGTRAIGTRISEEVYERVLVEGLPWIDRAFVVNNWYISAYEPIRDVKDEIIGILYVGILEEKFTDMRNRAIAIFLGIALTGMVIALIVSNFLAKGVLQPIKRLIFASHQWAVGNLDYRAETTAKDEIAELTETFNTMASSLKERDDRLKEYAHQQIMKSDRLATLGQLAAGVAHEINNPLGAVLMYAHLSLEEMEAEDARRKNLEKAVTEATRCKNIVRGLLDFARQSEPNIEESDVDEILKRTLSLLENQALFQNIKITTTLSASLPRAMMDSGQIQQVFTNIIFNAAEAMAGEGELAVVSRTTPGDEWVEIEFTDTGCGIPRENLEKIFDPFFTTKEVGRGTGLGLAVSYGIIARHKGTIEVESEPGKGTTFIVRLPLRIET
ncbi:MAG TPA: cache domain-containing protein [Sedimentisphaerales bacterium]|nr:cache domain-containing protein [Sedimentisphaerales bacterium]